MSNCNILKGRHIGKTPVILSGGWILDRKTSPNIWKVGVFLLHYYELEQRLGKYLDAMSSRRKAGRYS